MKKFIASALLVALAAIALVGCDALIAGTSAELNATKATAIGSGDAVATWTYAGMMNTNFTGMTGNFVVEFSQPVLYATPAAAAVAATATAPAIAAVKASGKADVKVVYNQGGQEKSKIISIDGESYSAVAADSRLQVVDGVSTFKLPMADVFAAVEANAAGARLVDDGIINATFTVSGFVSTTETDLDGDPAAVPALVKKVTIKPMLNSIPTLTVVTSIGLNKAKVEVPVNSSLTWSTFGLSTSSSLSGLKAYAGMDAAGEKLVVTFSDVPNSYRYLSGNVYFAFGGVKASDSDATSQVLDQLNLAVTLVPYPMTMLRYGSTDLAPTAITKYEVTDGSGQDGFAKVVFVQKNLPSSVTSVAVMGGSPNPPGEGKGIYAAESDFTIDGLHFNDARTAKFASLLQNVAAGTVTNTFYFKPYASATASWGWGDTSPPFPQVCFRFVDASYGNLLVGQSGGDGNIFLADVGAGKTLTVEVTLP